MMRRFLLLALLLSPSLVDAQVIPAFPGAEGFGSDAFSTASPYDCRSMPLQVVAVTTMNPTGVGSLEWAYETEARNDRFTVIIFTTGGTINYPGNWIRNVTKYCVYVAGQTAPGDGVQLVGDTTIVFGQWFVGGPTINRGSSDIVWRHLRIRENNTDSASTQGTAFTVGNATRVIAADMSIELSDDKNAQIDQQTGTGYPVADLITFQDNLIYAPLPSSTGFNIHGDSDTSPDSTIGSVSVIRNVMGGNKWRWPRVQAVTQAQVVNNIMHAWTSDGIRISSEQPSGCGFPACIRLNYEHVGNWHQTWGGQGLERFGSVEWNGGEKDGVPAMYAVGNRHNVLAPTAALEDQKQWRWREDRSGLLPDSAFKAAPVLSPRPTFDIDVLWTAQQTFDALTAIDGTVGDAEGVDCSGLWFPRRDAVDSTFIKEVRDNNILDTNRNANGTVTTAEWLASWGPWGRAIFLDPGTACPDSDADGLPDAFETLCVGDATSMTPGGDLSGDGYLNIEEYANGTNGSGRDLDWNDNSADEDGFHIERDKGSGWVRFASVGANVESYFDIDARVGDDYRVVAYNAFGESAPSNIDSAECR